MVLGANFFSNRFAKYGIKSLFTFNDEEYLGALKRLMVWGGISLFSIYILEMLILKEHVLINF
jgi:hypothetical protein